MQYEYTRNLLREELTNYWFVEQHEYRLKNAVVKDEKVIWRRQKRRSREGLSI